MKKSIFLVVSAMCFTCAYAQTTVNSIAEFKALASGTQATLNLTDAKVLYVYTSGSETQAYVRDGSGAIELVNPGVTLATNDDLNGSITGTFTLSDNVPQLTSPTANTLTATAGEAAEPVTLTDFSETTNHQCDLVQLKNGTYDSSGGGSVYDSDYNSVFFVDNFNTGFSPAGGGKLIVTGITVTRINDQGGNTNYLYPTDKNKSVRYYFSQDIQNTVPSWVEGGYVYLDRSPLYASHWNTFCVPFDMTADQVKQYFGEGTIINEFTSVDGTTMNFEANEDGDIVSGTPYLIKPAHDVTDFTFDGVDIYGDADNVSKSGYYFYGTFDPYNFNDGTEDNVSIDMTALFLGEGNKLYYASEDDYVMPGMRAFFWLPDDVKTAAKINIGGVVNAIENVTTDIVKTGGPVYNINGQYVGTSLKSLPKGVYIQNGKKYIK